MAGFVFVAALAFGAAVGGGPLEDHAGSHRVGARGEGVPRPTPSPFLNQAKEVPPRLEWNREVVTPTGGRIGFRISSQGPFAVTVITGKGYQALRRGNRAAFSKQDVLMTLDVSASTYEGKVTVPPGSSWFIIANQTDTQVKFSLQCFAAE